MSDKPIVVTGAAGSVSIKEALTSPKPLWIERRAPKEKVPMIIEPRYLTDPHLHDAIMDGVLTKGFPMASFVTRDLGLPSLNHKDRVTFPEVFHDFEYLSTMPYERFYHNTMKVIPLTCLYGQSFEVGRRTYTIGYPMPSNNLLGFDHRPDQAMSAIVIDDSNLYVGGYKIPGVRVNNYYSSKGALDITDPRWNEMYPEYGYYHQVQELLVDHKRKFYFPMGDQVRKIGGGLRRGELSFTSMHHKPK